MAEENNWRPVRTRLTFERKLEVLECILAVGLKRASELQRMSYNTVYGIYKMAAGKSSGCRSSAKRPAHFPEIEKQLVLEV